MLQVKLLNKLINIRLTTSQSNLGFGNYTGSGASSNEVSYFINYIISASTFYREDTASRLNYVSNQMSYNFGNPSSKFSVVQNAVGNVDNYMVYILDSEYATVSGVDTIYPSNSYLFAKQVINPGTTSLNLLNSGQRGYGMTNTLETVIKNIILSVEIQTNYCGCFYSDLTNISELLRQFDTGTWSVVCSSTPTIRASLYAFQGIATYVNPKACYYTLWRSN